MIFVCILIALFAVVGVRIRAPWYSAAFLVAVYSAISIIFLAATVRLGIGERVLQPWFIFELSQGEYPAALTFTLISLLALAASWLAPPAVRQVNIMRAVRTDVTSSPVIPIILSVLTVGLLIHAASLNYSKLWHTLVYTQQKNPYEMGVTLFPGVLFHYLMPITLIYCGALFLFHVSKGKMAIAIWTAIIFSYCWIYQFSAHSRWAAAALIFSATAHYLFRGRNRKAFLLLFVPLGVVALVHARIGRISGEHGLSTVFSTWKDFDVSQLPEYFLGTLYSILQGIFSVAASFSVSERIEYPASYRILSFSPFPSFIDGFDKIHEQWEFRISSTQPLSAWVEAANFGTVYFVLLSGLIFFTLWVNASLSKASREPAVVILSLVTLALIMFLASYEIRNVLRFLLLITAVNLLVIWRNGLMVRLGGRRRVRGRPYGPGSGPRTPVDARRRQPNATRYPSRTGT